MVKSSWFFTASCCDLPGRAVPGRTDLLGPFCWVNQFDPQNCLLPHSVPWQRPCRVETFLSRLGEGLHADTRRASNPGNLLRGCNSRNRSEYQLHDLAWPEDAFACYSSAAVNLSNTFLSKSKGTKTLLRSFEALGRRKLVDWAFRQTLGLMYWSIDGMFE